MEFSEVTAGKDVVHDDLDDWIGVWSESLEPFFRELEKFVYFDSASKIFLSFDPNNAFIY